MAFAKAVSGRSLFKSTPRFQYRNDRTYILPTLFGLTFGSLSFILLIVALGYNNNLLYLFVFFLISVCTTGMILTNQNVNRVGLKSIDHESVFAGQDNDLSLLLHNRGKTDCMEIHVSGKAFTGHLAKLLPGEEFPMQCVWHPSLRGYQDLPRLSLSSSFPFFMLRAWKVFTEKKTVLVFPKREGLSTFPLSSSADQYQANLGLFKELREFQKLDSLRRIDWRSSVKHQKLLIRSFEDIQPKSQHVFTWEATSHLPGIEARLSQLSLWLDLAHHHDLYYELHIPQFKSDLGNGTPHFRLCMSKLALFQTSEESTHEATPS